MRLIDADALERYMCDKCGERSICEYQGYGCSTIADIDEQPTIEAVPVKHGRWIRVIAEDYECSECKAAVWSRKANPISNYKYCWRCGAKMDEEVE